MLYFAFDSNCSQFCHRHMWRLSTSSSHLWCMLFGTNFSHVWGFGNSSTHVWVLIPIFHMWSFDTKFSHMMTWYQFFTDVRIWYQFFTRVSFDTIFNIWWFDTNFSHMMIWYKFFTDKRIWYQFFTCVSFDTDFFTCDDLIPSFHIWWFDTNFSQMWGFGTDSSHSVQSSIIIWAKTRENLSSGVGEQQRRRPACASEQSDQHLCYSLIGKYHIKTCYRRKYYVH